MEPNAGNSPPTEYTDSTGQRCVWVALTNSPDSWTTTLEAYRELLSEEGIAGAFRLQYHDRAARQVVTSVPGDGAKAVACLIAKAGSGQRVRFENKHSLDLRPRNLRVIAGAHGPGVQKPVSEAAARSLAHLKAADRAQEVQP